MYTSEAANNHYSDMILAIYIAAKVVLTAVRTLLARWNALVLKLGVLCGWPMAVLVMNASSVTAKKD